MKRSIVLAAGFAVVLPAYSQSSVTFYGLIDTGIEYVSHVAPEGKSLLRMPSTSGSFPSRWGVRGVEGIGNDVNVEFVVESGFYPNNGALAQGGRLFGRQAWVGITSPIGKLAFGRQYTLSYIGLIGTQIMGPGVYSTASVDPYLANGRSDNTVSIETKPLYGFSVSAAYSFGRDSTGTGNAPGQGTCAGSVPGDAKACREVSVMLKYASHNFGAAIVYDEQRGGANATADFYDGFSPFPIASSNDKDARFEASGWFRTGALKVGGGFIGRSVTGPQVVGTRSNIYYLGASYDLTPALVLAAENIRIIVSQHDARASMQIVRATYSLSVRTSVYTQVAYLENSAHARFTVSAGGAGTTPLAGENQLGAMVGIEHRF